MGANVIVWRSLIISGLSIAIVTVPPLRGRLGGGWYDCLKKSLAKHSNLFLPFGKVRMGYPTWNVRMGSRPRVGADAIRLVLIFCHYTCGLSWFIARYVCEVVTHPLLSTPFFVPFLGKHVAQVGQARYPTRASTLPHLGTFPSPLVPKIIPFSSHQYLPLLLLQRLVSSKRL